MKSWDETFMSVAQTFAERSRCTRLQVGAILVKDKRIISCGYNGVPSGMKHCDEVFTKEYVHTLEGRIKHHDFSLRNELHAEQNCLAYGFKSGITIDDNCILYVTTCPCTDCAKLICASGIKNVIYRDEYDRTSEGKKFLEESGINIHKI